MLTLDFESPAVKIGHAGNILHIAVHDLLDIRAIDEMGRAGLAVLRANPPGYGALVMAGETDFMPPPDARQRAIEVAKKVENGLLAVAVVMTSQGMKASVVRTMINTVLMAGRVRHTRIFDDVKGAVPWLLERLKAGHASVPVEADVIREAQEFCGASLHKV